MGQIALANCWYSRRHVPESVPRYRDDGVFRSQCRYCRSAIHSHDRKYWRLSNGFDPDEVEGPDYVAVVDQGDGLVIARVPLDADLRANQLKERLKEVRAQYEARQHDQALSLVVHRRANRRAHAH